MKTKPKNWTTSVDMKKDEEAWVRISHVDELIEQSKRNMIKKICSWCYANNTMPLKEVFKNYKGSLALASTDGGWVNVLKLEAFLRKLLEDGK